VEPRKPLNVYFTSKTTTPILSLGFHSYIPSPTYWNELFGSTLISSQFRPLVGIDYLSRFGPWEGAKYCGSRLRT
jgi:hypothetical protein